METTTTTQPNTPAQTSASATPKFAPRTTRRKPNEGSSSTSSPRGRSGGNTGGPKGGRSPRPEREKSEFEQKIVSIRRVTRVVAGGRRFSFAVAMLIGDKKGKIGFGTGKSNDTSLAINKALQDAKKHMMVIPRTKNASIPHEVFAKFKSSEVWISPNKDKGLVSGSAIRDIFNLAGMTDITAKIFSRSKNPINNVRATFKALEKLPKEKKVVAPVAITSESTSEVK